MNSLFNGYILALLFVIFGNFVLFYLYFVFDWPRAEIKIYIMQCLTLEIMSTFLEILFWTMSV